MSAEQRRQAVRFLQQQFHVSERRACRVVGQHRSTQRRPAAKVSDRQRRLTKRMHELARRHPRYGYRRIWALLRRQGWRINRKRVYRLWRQEGLRVPRKARKRRRAAGANSCARRPALHKNHVWAWDFLFDRTGDGRPLKWFTLVDEYTRECLALEVRRAITARVVTDVLAEVIGERGSPVHIRSDNGPEFIAVAIRGWLAGRGLETLYIDPAAPWENGYAESFNSKVRDELLNVEEFDSVAAARVLAREWRAEYNGVRPHSALAYRTPAEYAAEPARRRL